MGNPERRCRMTARTEELLRADLEHIIHPSHVAGQHIELVFEGAHGITLVDTEGNEYIDTSSQLMCCNLGHGRKEIKDAIVEAMAKTDYTTLFFGYCSTLSIECGQKLAEVTPGDLKHFYFTSGGSESVDSAIKLVRLCWHNKGRDDKYKIISLYNSYHGEAGTSTYLTRSYHGAPQRGFGPEPGGLLRVPPYYCYRCTFGAEYPSCNMRCAQYLEDTIKSEGEDSVAAFIAEPIQGAGGIIDPPPEYWPLVRKICTEHDVLLIVDEVMTGFARTGKMFAIEHWNVQPDVMTMAKGITAAYLPFGAVAVGDRVFETLKGKHIEHGLTYCGHPLCCAASIAALDVYVKQRVVENAAKVGNHIRKRLEAEFLPLPCVGTIGGKGMFQAFELVSDKESKTPISPSVKKELEAKIRKAGIFARITGSLFNRFVIAPPCTMTVEEADRMLDIIQPIVAGLK